MDVIELEAASPPAGAGFKWPAPPYFEFSDPGETTRKECLLVLADGRRLQAGLLRFEPDAALIKLDLPALAGAAAATGMPAFADIVRLHLTRPRRLKRQALPSEITEAEIFPVSERQTFSVELQGGERFDGETRGFVNAQSGLFLFPPVELDQVTCHFLPAAGIKGFQIGPPIGQILIEQNLASKEVVAAALERQRQLRSQKLGDVLTDNEVLSTDELAAALKHQQQKPILRLGEVLIELGLLSGGELDSALKMQERNRKIPLGQILIDMGVINEDTIKAVMTKKLGIPFVNLRKFRISPSVIQKIPVNVAQRHNVIAVFQTNAELVVAIENPLATAVLEELRFLTAMKILPVMAGEDDIRAAIQKNYTYLPDLEGSALDILPAGSARNETIQYQHAAGETRIDALATQLSAEIAETEPVDESVAETDNTLVKLLNKVILDAYQQNASDIHIETYPGKKDTRIRFRKDGVLVNYLSLPSKFRSALVSRIKIMSTLDISERRKPQDGKIDFSRFGPVALELRVATIPTANGLEDVVMRLLAAAQPLPIERLGFSAKVLGEVRQMMGKPHGLFLVCGPTGSGKTTTLHSLLGYINTDERKIWTAEDPIEITQAGLRQVQVNAKIGWTFASAMRSFLRADPDVIMVGEMRDAETTRTGIEASLTGHLVLSTLHTNSAPESVVRLLDMGMDPFNFADALLGVLAQRLARRLCPACKQTYTPAAPELDEMVTEYCVEGVLDADRELQSWREQYADPAGKIGLCRVGGCEDCGGTGYRGRIGLHELLLADAAVKHLIQTHATVTAIKATAVATGMRTLKQSGIEKVLQGLSDMHQIRAVCG